jgi:hypothetical protein
VIVKITSKLLIASIERHRRDEDEGVNQRQRYVAEHLPHAGSVEHHGGEDAAARAAASWMQSVEQA